MPFRSIFGWIIIVFASFLMIGALSNAEERGWQSSDTSLWWLGAFLPVAVGALMVSSKMLRNLDERQNALEDAILRTAEARGGGLSAADLAQATPLSLEAAEQSLKHLSRRGFLTPELSDEGTMVYRIGLTSTDQSADTNARQPGVHAPARPADVSTGIHQIQRTRRPINSVTWGVIGVLFIVSVAITTLGYQIWPTP